MESITTSCHEIHDHIVTKASQIENATVTTTSISDNNMKLHSTKSHSPIGTPNVNKRSLECTNMGPDTNVNDSGNKHIKINKIPLFRCDCLAGKYIEQMIKDWFYHKLMRKRYYPGFTKGNRCKIAIVCKFMKRTLSASDIALMDADIPDINDVVLYQIWLQIAMASAAKEITMTFF